MVQEYTDGVSKEIDAVLRWKWFGLPSTRERKQHYGFSARQENLDITIPRLEGLKGPAQDQRGRFKAVRSLEEFVGVAETIGREPLIPDLRNIGERSGFLFG
jgi:hypothetical protein